MYSARARSFFMIFIGMLLIPTIKYDCIKLLLIIGTILFTFSLFGKLLGILMLANAGFNIYILFRYPDYERIQRNDALSEINGFLATHPAFAKSMMDAGVKAGTEIIRNNPGDE
jgi:hypothetical protein